MQTERQKLRTRLAEMRQNTALCGRSSAATLLFGTSGNFTILQPRSNSG